MTRREALLALTAPAAAAGIAKAQKVDLPPPYHTPSANNRPQVIDRPDGAKVNLPPGFRIEPFLTDGFLKPRYMILGPSGELLISDSDRSGSVHMVNLDPKTFAPRDRKKLIDGLDRPFGMDFFGGDLYVAETTSLKRYSYNKQGKSVGAGKEIVPMHEYDKGHWTRAVIFDQSAKKMYLTIGSASNVDGGEPRPRAAIHRYNPDGTGQEYVAEGTRNPTSIHFYPGTKNLWAAIQERDGLGDRLVPDYLTQIKEGGFYGWPYAYIGPNEDPRRKGEKPDLVKKTIVPDIVLGAHVAVIDFRFYTGKQFPAKYRGGAFLAFHGSWNRADRIGYSITFVPFKNGRPAGPVEDFATGWMLGPDQREVWGRPVGLLELPDGSLLLSDDGSNKIWRISYIG